MARRASGLLHWALALPAALGLGCSYYSQADGERLRDEVYALQTQVTALQRTLQEVEAQQAKSDKQLTKITADIAELNTAARRNDADIGVVLDVVRQDVARMKGQVDLLSERMSEVEAKSAKTQEELDLRFQGLAAKEKIREAETAKEKAEAERAAAEREKLLSSPDAALKEAEQLLTANQPAEARRLIRALVIKQSDGKGWKTYAPKAHYLIGETYFAEEDFQQAAAAYNTVRKKYPTSKTWLPGSILKLGMCFDRLGLKDDAKLFYQTVARKFPRHPAGQEGKRLLDKLES